MNFINSVGIDTYCKLHHIDEDEFPFVEECKGISNSQLSEVKSFIIEKDFHLTQKNKDLQKFLKNYEKTDYRYKMNAFQILLFFILASVPISLLILRCKY